MNHIPRTTVDRKVIAKLVETCQWDQAILRIQQGPPVERKAHFKDLLKEVVQNGPIRIARKLADLRDRDLSVDEMESMFRNTLNRNWMEEAEEIAMTFGGEERRVKLVTLFDKAALNGWTGIAKSLAKRLAQV